MKKLNFLIMLTLASTMMTAQNPFFKQAKTPHETFPFNELKDEYYMPAFEEGIKQHQAEINKIANNKQLPTFENTIVAKLKTMNVMNIFLNIISLLKKLKGIPFLPECRFKFVFISLKF